MKGFAKGIVKTRVLILIIAFSLLIPAAIGFINTRINYDILTYLPSEEQLRQEIELQKQIFLEQKSK